MGIAEEVASADAQRRRDQVSRYVALLKKNSTDAAEIEQLHQLMNALGKSPSDVQRDAAVLRSVDTVQARIASAKGVHARVSAAQSALPAFDQETAAIANQRAAQRDQLSLALVKAQKDSADATRDVENLNTMKVKNAELLAHVKPAVQADLD